MAYTKPSLASNANINQDFSGKREVIGNQELVQFHKKSFVRTWFNDLALDYESHWHSAIEIILPLENYYEISVQDETYHINPGEIIMIPPGEIHSIHAPETGNRLVFLFELQSLTNMENYSGISSLLSRTNVFTPESPAYPQIYELLMKIQEEYFAPHEYAELSIYAYLIQLLVSVGYDHIYRPDLFPNVREQKQKEYIHKFNQLITYIDQNITEDFDIDEISESTGFSKYHFLRLFKQYTGSTFADYVNLRKIKACEKLLEDSALSIGEIAASSGFSSISTFNRLFKQYKGCSPTEYRSRLHAGKSFLKEI